MENGANFVVIALLEQILLFVPTPSKVTPAMERAAIIPLRSHRVVVVIDQQLYNCHRFLE